MPIDQVGNHIYILFCLLFLIHNVPFIHAELVLVCPLGDLSSRVFGSVHSTVPVIFANSI